MYNSKKIKEICEKRIQTTMIGSLSRIEKSLGYLWGHDKEEYEDLTDKEKEFLDVWEFLRNDILNYGNGQIRKFRDDFGKNEGQCKTRYSYTFPVNKNKD